MRYSMGLSVLYPSIGRINAREIESQRSLTKIHVKDNKIELLTIINKIET